MICWLEFGRRQRTPARGTLHLDLEPSLEALRVKEVAARRDHPLGWIVVVHRTHANDAIDPPLLLYLALHIRHLSHGELAVIIVLLRQHEFRYEVTGAPVILQ